MTVDEGRIVNPFAGWMTTVFTAVPLGGIIAPGFVTLIVRAPEEPANTSGAVDGDPPAGVHVVILAVPALRAEAELASPMRTVAMTETAARAAPRRLWDFTGALQSPRIAGATTAEAACRVQFDGSVGRSFLRPREFSGHSQLKRRGR